MPVNRAAVRKNSEVVARNSDLVTKQSGTLYQQHPLVRAYPATDPNIFYISQLSGLRLYLDAAAEANRRGLGTGRTAEDRFNRGLGSATNLSTYSDETGKQWTAWSGTINNRSSGSNDAQATNAAATTAYALNTSIFNGVIRALITEATTNAQRRGLLFRGVSGGATYLAAAIDGQNSVVELVKVSSGTATQLASWAHTADSGQHMLEATYNGNDITVTLDGTDLGTYTLTGGDITTYGAVAANSWAGLTSYNSAAASATWDMFRVDPLNTTLWLSQWSDDSGNDFHATQSTASKKPLLCYDGVRWVVRGIATAAMPTLMTGSASISSATNGTLLIGLIPQTIAAGTPAFFGSCDEGSTTRFFVFGRNAANLRLDQRQADTADTATGNTALVVDTPVVATLSSSGTAWTAYANNATADTLTFTSGSNTGDWLGDTPLRDNYTIFGRKLSSGSELNAFVDLCTVVLVDTELSAANRTATVNAIINQNYFNDPGSVTITKPKQYQVFQRDLGTTANVGDIAISGTCATRATAVEARWNGGPWQTIDTSVSTGAYSGTLNNQPGGQGTLEVRAVGSAGSSAVSAYVSTVGVGEVFGYCGQSNFDGPGDNNQTYSHATLKAAMYKANGAWAELADPASGNGGTILPLLATHLMGALNVPVAFITTTEDGSGLAVTGLSGDRGQDWVAGNEYQALFITTVNNSNTTLMRCVMWDQHGCEATAGDGGGTFLGKATYKSRLEAMIDDWQSDLSMADLVLVCGVLGHLSGAAASWPNADDVRAAYNEEIASNADFKIGGNNINLTLDAPPHWELDAELASSAYQWYRALQAAFASDWGGSVGRGPRFSSAAKTAANTITVTFTVANGGLTLGASPTVGWRVADNSGTRTVSAASVSGDVVTLTISGAAIGSSPTVSFGEGMDAVGATILDVLNMPPEPFQDQAVTV